MRETPNMEDRTTEDLPTEPRISPAARTEMETKEMGMNIVSELEQLASALDGDESRAPDEWLPALAEKIAQELQVKTDEVAILGLSPRWKHLYFLAPQGLKNIGYIPLTSNAAVAARTVRESRPEVNNNFLTARHASVFEGVKAPTTTGESIQKIISAPILCDGKVVGVVQISRKGGSPASSGPDFTAEDLEKVLALCRPLGKLVSRIAEE